MEFKWFYKCKFCEEICFFNVSYYSVFNGDSIFFIQPSTSLNLFCISNISHFQLSFNLQLKNEHVRRVCLTKWPLGMFYMRFFYFFRVLSVCVWKISFSIKSKVLLSFSVKNILDGWFWAKTLGNEFCKKKPIFEQFVLFTFILIAFIKNLTALKNHLILNAHKRFTFCTFCISAKLFLNWKLLF